MHDLLRIADLDLTQLEGLLDLADQARAHPHRWNDLLQGESVVLHLAKPSTRTRISFETAVARLGGVPISTGPDGAPARTGRDHRGHRPGHQPVRQGLRHPHVRG